MSSMDSLTMLFNSENNNNGYNNNFYGFKCSSQCLRTLKLLTNLTLTITLVGNYSYCVYFTNEKFEAKESEVTHLILPVNGGAKI